MVLDCVPEKTARVDCVFLLFVRRRARGVTGIREMHRDLLPHRVVTFQQRLLYYYSCR